MHNGSPGDRPILRPEGFTWSDAELRPRWRRLVATLGWRPCFITAPLALRAFSPSQQRTVNCTHLDHS